MAHTVGIRELRHDARAVLERVAEGDVVVTDRGRPIARITASGDGRRPRIDRALAHLARLGPSDTGWRDERAAETKAEIARPDRW